MQQLERENYMGVLVINHITQDTPQYCIGAQIDSPAITEIALYRAAFDPNTRRVIKEGLLSKCRMTDGQFGQMIARPNFNDGQVATLEWVAGFDVPAAEPSTDPLRQRLKAAVDKALGADSQIMRFINTLDSLAATAIEKGQVSSAVKKEMIHLLSLIGSNLPSNEAHYLREFHEVSNDRVLEVAQSIHRFLRQPAGQTNIALTPPAIDAKPLPVLPPPALLKVSVGGSSSIKLFDDINTHSCLTSLEFSAARIESSSVDNEPRYRDARNLWTIDLSPSQYTRMLRANCAEVPCTIRRLWIDGCKGSVGEVQARHTAEMPADRDNTLQSTPTLSNLVEESCRIMESLSNNAYKGKANIKRMAEDIQSLRTLYDTHLNGRQDDTRKALVEIVMQHQQKAQHYLQYELSALPDGEREQAKRLLGGLVKLLDNKSIT